MVKKNRYSDALNINTTVFNHPFLYNGLEEEIIHCSSLSKVKSGAGNKQHLTK